MCTVHPHACGCFGARVCVSIHAGMYVCAHAYMKAHMYTHTCMPSWYTGVTDQVFDKGNSAWQHGAWGPWVALFFCAW